MPDKCKPGIAAVENPVVGVDPRESPAPRSMRIALFQPDIAPNTGTILRLCACLGVEAHIIEPAGFPTTDRAFRRAGLDYLDKVILVRHPSWAAFQAFRGQQRIVLFTTSAETSYLNHAYDAGDYLLFGRESAGVPEEVHEAADVRVRIPMRPLFRSLNVATAAAMAIGEAMRQHGMFNEWVIPESEPSKDLSDGR